MLRILASRLAKVGQETRSSCPRILPITQTRCKSYYDSNFEEPPQNYTGVEKSYAEWKWVERLIPVKYVPEPSTDPSLEFPSGWKAPNPSEDSQYMIRRTKSHMIPVYCKMYERGQRREIRIRYVEGNIWKLEKDIGRHLKSLHPDRVIHTYTQECARFVGIKGDFLDEVKEWVAAKGF